MLSIVTMVSPRWTLSPTRLWTTMTVPGIGAAGITHDWSIDRRIKEAVSVPVVLAGGLGPDNVEAAIAAVHPDGVDSLTATSVKENGILVRKDIEKVRAFCKKAHSFGV
ncbi:MAG: hypothetical protein IKD61_02685 [Oscillospiraceae bacterium]|nr:hypothetical protein [Oscillospiraceae bacterium]